MSTPTVATNFHPSPHHFSFNRTQPFASNNATTYRSVLPTPARYAPSYPTTTSYPTPSVSTAYGGVEDYGTSVSRSSRPDLSEYSISSDKTHSAMLSTRTVAQPPQQPLQQQQQQQQQHYTPESSSSAALKRKRQGGNPDWEAFYKNGLPKEIIVIDDSPEPESFSHAAASRTLTTARAANDYAYSANGTVATDGSVASTVGNSQRVAKKLKLDLTDTGRYDHTRPSGSIAPHHNGTPTNSTISSSDRTHSAIHTTASTSLGSLSSNGHYDLEAQPGQKRKRTRGQLASETKRKEIGVMGHAYSSYYPPPHPPKKAAEVRVKVIGERVVVRTPVEEKSNSAPAKHDDEDGHYIVVPDADLTERYTMVKLLGQGTFGKVVQAQDKKKNELVAIKIIRSVQKYRDASRIELRVLATLKANDEANRNRCIHLRDCFDYRGHICIVMDLLGQSVFDFLKGNNFVPFPNSQIQSFARQLLTSVAFLHDLNLIHTDLKPENILLFDSGYQTFTYNRKIPSSSATVARQATQRRVLLDTEIRLIDFGSATFQDEYHSSVVSTRHYRAPEIILGLGWSFPCDIWSIGCILIEFFTGDALFQTHDNLEHLAMMESVVNAKIDSHLVTKVNKSNRNGTQNTASQYFKRLRLDYPQPDTTRASRRFVKAMKRLDEIIPNTSPFFKNFRDLLKKIFVYDPAVRITAKDALNHPWFNESAHPDDGTEAARIKRERMLQRKDAR